MLLEDHYRGFSRAYLGSNPLRIWQCKNICRSFVCLSNVVCFPRKVTHCSPSFSAFIACNVLTSLPKSILKKSTKALVEQDSKITRATRTSGEEDTSKCTDSGDAGALWIVKPTDSSRGRGIYLLRELRELAYEQPSIVQRYISDPLTVGGYKADLRL